MLTNTLKLQNELAWLKDLKNPPEWSECEKRIIAWALCWEGWLYVDGPEVGIYVNDEFLLKEFAGIVRFGNVGSPTANDGRWKWRVQSTREIAYLLLNIMPYLPSKRGRAKRLLNLCLEKIKKEDSASTITM